MIKGFTTDTIGSYAEKDGEAVIDYSIDWSEWLTTGDNIASSTWTISTISGDTDPLTESTSSIDTDTKYTQIIVSGGTPHGQYTVTNRITTDEGLTEERYFRINIVDKSA